MGFINDIKSSKQKQNELLDKIAQYPTAVRLVAKAANVGTRLLTPLWILLEGAQPRHRQQLMFMHRIVRDELESKLHKYATMMTDKSDSQGFIEHEHCDSLLFTGLVSSTPFWNAMMLAARDEEGAWHRRPTSNPCYPHSSRSTISRDMFLGLFWYIWRKQRLDLAEELWDYGVKNDWIMGQGDVSRIYLTPGLQATLAEIIYQLGGKAHHIARSLPQSWADGLEGYQAHLQCLHILLRGELKGYITESMQRTLADLAGRHSSNHLYEVALARYSANTYEANTICARAALGLENVDYWPKDRLPSDADRSSRWLFEDNVLTKGDDPDQLHTGGDLVFCASLILDYSDLAD